MLHEKKTATLTFRSLARHPSTLILPLPADKTALWNARRKGKRYRGTRLVRHSWRRNWGKLESDRGQLVLAALLLLKGLIIRSRRHLSCARVGADVYVCIRACKYGTRAGSWIMQPRNLCACCRRGDKKPVNSDGTSRARGWARIRVPGQIDGVAFGVGFLRCLFWIRYGIERTGPGTLWGEDRQIGDRDRKLCNIYQC